MKLVEVKLTNFRGYEYETPISIDPLTVIVGRNDSGKSSILDALEIFFNDGAIDHDDCCVRSASTDIRIACVFDELPDSIVIDEQHPTTLGSEHLLKQNGLLEVIKVYDCSSISSKGKLANTYAKAFHPNAPGVDDLLSKKINELRTIAQTRAVDVSGINQTAKAQIRQAIWGSVADLEFVERDISLKKESAKDAFDQIQKYMPIYALFKSDRPSTDQDSEAQDPLKTAIKEAIRRHETTLNTVVDEIKGELARVADRTVDKIREMNDELANQLHPFVKNKNWDTLFSVTLTGDEDIPINKRGSGTRRIILLNFFRAKAEESALNHDGGVIYAIEEPETSQHPDYQIMLLEAFQDLVEQGNCQVLITTHTPTLARRVDRGLLRLIHRVGTVPTVEYGNADATLQKIKSTLGVLPDHDVKAFLGVEGKHDINFLRRISKILAAAEHDIPDLEKEEQAGRLVFMSLGGSNMELWVSTVAGFDRPEFYLTDRDVAPPANPKYQRYIDAWTTRGCMAWATSKKELENYLHPSVLISEAPGYTGTGDDFEDVPMLFAEAIHNTDPDASPWADIAAEKKKDRASSVKKRLNTVCVSRMTPALLGESDPRDDIRTWLRSIRVALND